MAYKSILVQAEPGDFATARLKCAAALADRFDAALLGVAAECVIPSTLADAYNTYSGEWVVALSEQIEANFRSAEENFRSNGGPRRKSWMTERAMPAEVMARASRAADLIVAGGCVAKDRDVYNSADIVKLILSSGRPVLFAPPQGEFCSAKQILVAAKDTRESRRAIADALPFMKEADDVVILEICKASELTGAQERVAEIATALARHGVKARGQAQDSYQDDVGAILLERASHLGADLIVAGAYGHSRLGEWVFGGATRDLLFQTERFVMFSN
jgi:nucleotide-binding universal stress UspA family protein